MVGLKKMRKEPLIKNMEVSKVDVNKLEANPWDDSYINSTKRKTQLCWYFTRGHCERGKFCNFAHGIEELAKGSQDKSNDMQQQISGGHKQNQNKKRNNFIGFNNNNNNNKNKRNLMINNNNKQNNNTQTWQQQRQIQMQQQQQALALRQQQSQQQQQQSPVMSYVTPYSHHYPYQQQTPQMYGANTTAPAPTTATANVGVSAGAATAMGSNNSSQEKYRYFWDQGLLPRITDNRSIHTADTASNDSESTKDSFARQSYAGVNYQQQQQQQQASNQLNPNAQSYIFPNNANQITQNDTEASKYVPPHLRNFKQ